VPAKPIVLLTRGASAGSTIFQEKIMADLDGLFHR